MNEGKTVKKHIGLMIGALNSGGAERVVAHLSHILSDAYHVHVILFEDTHIEYECGGVKGTMMVKPSLWYDMISCICGSC